MDQENKFKEYSEEKVKIYKEKWDKDFFCGVRLIDITEIFFIVIGILIFFCLSWGFKVSFVVVLVLSYWFRIKRIEKNLGPGAKLGGFGGLIFCPRAGQPERSEGRQISQNSSRDFVQKKFGVFSTKGKRLTFLIK
ncbi:MAG: hypothetical protein NTX55_00130 [Candidatus Parcubacteria bacterium]|nr:hypothetical protein [Candidatus Parcubacteria bacterium]